MNRKIIFALILVSILNLSFVSANLCRGRDGYYHDCDDDKFFEPPDYDNYYYYHGKYYPSRDYYYRNYYETGCASHCKTENYYKDTEEYNRVIEYKYKDKYGYENIKTSIITKTEIESDYKLPYNLIYYTNKFIDEDKNEKKQDTPIISYVPYHYSLYKEFYS